MQDDEEDVCCDACPWCGSVGELDELHYLALDERAAKGAEADDDA